MSDPRDTQHVQCDCVPTLGPPHYHLCSNQSTQVIEWPCANGRAITTALEGK